jgi:hypothetical protein
MPVGDAFCFDFRRPGGGFPCGGLLVLLQITQYRAEGGDERRSICVGHQSIAFYPLAKALESKDQQASAHAGRFQKSGSALE